MLPSPIDIGEIEPIRPRKTYILTCNRMNTLPLASRMFLAIVVAGGAVSFCPCETTKTNAPYCHAKQPAERTQESGCSNCHDDSGETGEPSWPDDAPQPCGCGHHASKLIATDAVPLTGPLSQFNADFDLPVPTSDRIDPSVGWGLLIGNANRDGPIFTGRSILRSTCKLLV